MVEAIGETPGAHRGEADAAGLCERVLAVLDGRAEAVVTAEVGASALTRFANGHIHQNTSERKRGVRLTVALDDRVARATTTRTDDDGLAALVERALGAAALRPADPDFAGFAPSAAVAPVEHWDEGTAAATPDDRAEVVAGFVRAGGVDRGDASAGEVQAAGFCATRAVAHALASTTGQRAAARSTVAEVDGIHRAADRAGELADGCAQATSVRLSDIDGVACGARAAAKAWSGLDPVGLPPGEYEVVFEPRAVAAALVFPALLGFNGKAHAEGTSFVHLGEAQWDELVELWDDATDPRALGDPYDAEGTPKRRHELVRAGASVGLVHDRRSARLAGVEPTGHAMGSDAFGGVATDLFLGGGEHAPDVLVAGVERGLLVSDLWYNRILDPKTQVVTGLTRNGLFLIEDGRITRPVQNLRYTQSIVAGFGPGRVLGLGSDAQLVGSEGGVSMRVPSVRLAAWSFTGNARG
ncbi:MAG: metallopeptidase TldD-related protein [Acidimicrobiales bacterium]|nr:metallopeptidase TldD-related protein [Acidimicrobiales bacterium]